MNSQPVAQASAYFEAHGETVRERLLNALKTDLLGPEAPDEQLAQSPSTRYLIGMLAPQGHEAFAFGRRKCDLDRRRRRGL